MEAMLAGGMGRLAGAVPVADPTSKSVAVQDNHSPSFTDTRRIAWTRRPIREDAPDTLQAFLRRSESDGSAASLLFPRVGVLISWSTINPTKPSSCYKGILESAVIL